MATRSETSDAALIELLRSSGDLAVSEIAKESDVTATSVRQRLTRLMAQGLVQREARRNGRGRPAHRYSLTEKARRQAGNNFADLAIALWRELRGIKDPEVRRGLLQRIAASMSQMYAGRINGDTVEERMESLADLFAERRVPVSAAAPSAQADGDGETAAELPVLTVADCPYPALAEEDRGICALERMVFSELVEGNLRLSQCRLDGDACCQFQAG